MLKVAWMKIKVKNRLDFFDGLRQTVDNIVFDQMGYEQELDKETNEPVGPKYSLSVREFRYRAFQVASDFRLEKDLPEPSMDASDCLLYRFSFADEDLSFDKKVEILKAIGHFLATQDTYELNGQVYDLFEHVGLPTCAVLDIEDVGDPTLYVLSSTFDSNKEYSIETSQIIGGSDHKRETQELLESIVADLTNGALQGVKYYALEDDTRV